VNVTVESASAVYLLCHH